MRRGILLALVLVAAAKDEDAIKKIASDYEAVFNKGDAKAEAALYAEDGDLIDPAGKAFRGRAEIEQGGTQAYATIFKGAHITITPTHTRIVDPDMAIVDGNYEITGAHMRDGKPAPTFKGLYTMVFRKAKGKWWIESLRPMVPQGPPPGAMAPPAKK